MMLLKNTINAISSEGTAMLIVTRYYKIIILLALCIFFVNCGTTNPKYLPYSTDSGNRTSDNIEKDYAEIKIIPILESPHWYVMFSYTDSGELEAIVTSHQPSRYDKEAASAIGSFIAEGGLETNVKLEVTNISRTYRVISFSRDMSKPKEEWTPLEQFNYEQNMAKYVLLGPVWGPAAGLRDKEYPIYYLPPGEVNILVSYYMEIDVKDILDLNTVTRITKTLENVISETLEAGQTYYITHSGGLKLLREDEFQALSKK